MVGVRSGLIGEDQGIPLTRRYAATSAPSMGRGWIGPLCSLCKEDQPPTSPLFDALCLHSAAATVSLQRATWGRGRRVAAGEGSSLFPVQLRNF